MYSKHLSISVLTWPSFRIGFRFGSASKEKVGPGSGSASKRRRSVSLLSQETA